MIFDPGILLLRIYAPEMSHKSVQYLLTQYNDTSVRATQILIDSRMIANSFWLWHIL